VTDQEKHLVSLEPREVEVTSQEKELLDMFLDFIEKNIKSKIDIDLLCKKLFLSKTDLYRKIKAITGEAPKEFIESFRLKRAMQLLRKNFGSVRAVGLEVGFTDEFHFSKRFKNLFGKSPKQYQKAYQESISTLISASPGEVPNIGNKNRRFSLNVDFVIDELDRAIIERVALTQTGQYFHFDDETGTQQRIKIFEVIEKLYNASVPMQLNRRFSHLTLAELFQFMSLEILEQKKKISRNVYYSDARLEIFDLDVTLSPAIRNAQSVAVVCMQEDLQAIANSYFELSTKTYGSTFNLSTSESFYFQPSGAGDMKSGVLVGEDIVVTSAGLISEKNVSDLRFVFEYQMEDPETPVKHIHSDNIYQGAQVLHMVEGEEGDWVLVKLDRKVTDRKFVPLSQRNIFYEQPLYIIGHPCSLPMKYAPGAFVDDIADNYFRADLDVYSSGIGSPIFCANTHELVGLVSEANYKDFRWTGNGWVTMSYPKINPEYQGSLCTRVAAFSKYLESS
jgi:AraC-like DNA-binding protein